MSDFRRLPPTLHVEVRTSALNVRRRNKARQQDRGKGPYNGKSLALLARARALARKSTPRTSTDKRQLLPALRTESVGRIRCEVLAAKPAAHPKDYACTVNEEFYRAEGAGPSPTKRDDRTQ